MNTLIGIIYILMFIGTINWVMIGLFNYDIVAVLFGEMSTALKILYTIIGLSAFLNLTAKYYQCVYNEDSCCLIAIK